MTHNLTDTQQALARWLVAERDAERLGDTFFVLNGSQGRLFISGHPQFSHDKGDAEDIRVACPSFKHSLLEALVADGMLLVVDRSNKSRRFTFRKRIFDAVRSGFADESPLLPVSTLAHAIPPELNLSLDRLRKKYPDPAKLGFLIMRFTPGRVFDAIIAAIKQTAAKHDIAIVRADEHEFHSDLWGNVRTFLHGCSFGVAVYERIEQEEPNANVGLEIGYLLAMYKAVLLLKERTVRTLQADLMGKLYKEFDEHDPANTIPAQLERWLSDNGVIVAPPPAISDPSAAALA